MAQPKVQRKLSRRAPGIADIASPPSPLNTRPFLVEETCLDEKLPRYSDIISTTIVTSSKDSVLPSERWRRLLRWLTQTQKDKCCPIGCGLNGQADRPLSEERRPLLKHEKIDYEKRLSTEKCALPTDLYKGIDLSRANVSTHKPRRPRPTIIDSVLYTDEYDSSRTGSPEGRLIRRRKSSAGEKQSVPKLLDHPDLPLGTTTPPRTPPLPATTPAQKSTQLPTRQYDHPDLPVLVAIPSAPPASPAMPLSPTYAVTQLGTTVRPQPPLKPLRTLSHSKSQSHLESQPDTEPDPEVKHVPRRSVSFAKPPPSVGRSHSATLVTPQVTPPVPEIPKSLIAKSKSVSHGRSRSDSSAAHQQRPHLLNPKNNAFAASGVQRAHTTKVKSSAWWVEKNLMVAEVKEVRPVQMPVVASGHAKLVMQAKRGSGGSNHCGRHEELQERPESQESRGSWLDLDGDDA